MFIQRIAFCWIRHINVALFDFSIWNKLTMKANKDSFFFLFFFFIFLESDKKQIVTCLHLFSRIGNSWKKIPLGKLMFLLIRDVIIFHKFQVKKYYSLYNYTNYHKDSFTEITFFCIFTIKYNVQKWNTLCFEFSGRDTFSDLDKFMFIMHRLIIHTVLHTDLVCTVFTKRHLW